MQLLIRVEITKIHLTDNGNGFTKLPTVTIDPARGTKVLDTQGNYDNPVTCCIDMQPQLISVRIDEILVTDGGANYSTTELPDITARANFVVKDVTGTFVTGESLTTHTGIVQNL